MNVYIVMGLGIALLLTVGLMPIFIPLLKRMKFGQSIREEGPESHMKKTGTPTMGGLVFLISIIITVLLVAWFAGLLTAKVLILLLVLFGYGMIGFLDDFIKVVLKRNLGLTSLQKLIAQIVIAVISFFVLAASILKRDSASLLQLFQLSYHGCMCSLLSFGWLDFLMQSI